MARITLAVSLLACALARRDRGAVKEKDAYARYKFEQERRELLELTKRERRIASDGHYLGLTASITFAYGMVFCSHCTDPHAGGVYIQTFESTHNPANYHVDGELVLAVPNDASTPLLDRVGGAIVLAERGGVSIVTKARHAQEGGATALVVIDSLGHCNEDFECDAALGSKASDHFFGLLDRSDAWSDIFIPVVVVTKAEGERLKREMRTSDVHIDGMGTHVYTVQQQPMRAPAHAHYHSDGL